MQVLKKFIPTHTPRPQNYHHYICFGNIHVKFATFLIILFRLFFSALSVYYFLTGHLFYTYWIDVLYDFVEFGTLVCLILGYLKEESKWTWPYMTTEFTCLIMALIIYAFSITAIIWPERYSGWSAGGKIVSGPADIRKYAFRSLAESAFFAALCAFEISILLACNRYFDDEKARKQDLRERPIIINSQKDHRNNGGVVVDMEAIDDDDDHKSASTSAATSSATTAMNRNREGGGGGFPNPNFSLVDSDDELDTTSGWHSTNKKANILA